MDYNKKDKDILHNIQEFEQNLRLRGSITPKRDIQESFNIFERLGFTTSINSEIRFIEYNDNIKILSPFSQSQKSQTISQPNKFGLLSAYDIDQLNLNPPLKRFKFINNFLMRILLIAIIINFILIFLL